MNIYIIKLNKLFVIKKDLVGYIKAIEQIVSSMRSIIQRFKQENVSTEEDDVSYSYIIVKNMFWHDLFLLEPLDFIIKMTINHSL